MLQGSRERSSHVALLEQGNQLRAMDWSVMHNLSELLEQRGHGQKDQQGRDDEQREEDQGERVDAPDATPFHPLDQRIEGAREDEGNHDQQRDRPKLKKQPNPHDRRQDPRDGARGDLPANDRGVVWH